MAGIGIKANISLNKKQLSLDIAGIQKQIADTGSVFKLSIDGGTIAQLGELKNQLKEIIDLAGNGIKIKIDTKVIQEAKKEAKELKEVIENSSDLGGVTSGKHGSYESSMEKANKIRHDFLADTNEETKTTMQYVDELGQAYTEIWKLNKKSGDLELDSMSDVEDFVRIQKEVDKVGQSFVTVRQKYNQMNDDLKNSDVDLEIGDSFRDVSDQITFIKNQGNLVDVKDVERMRLLVLTSQSLVDMKSDEIKLTKEQQALTLGIQKARDKIALDVSKLKDKPFVKQEDLDRINAMGDALKNVGSQDELKNDVAKVGTELNKVRVASQEATNGIKGMSNESHGLKKLSDSLAKMGLYFSAWRLTSEVFQEFKRGIGIVAELDNQIVQVGIDMNVTAQESKSLVTQAQRIATETGTAIDAVIRVAGVYSNANETMESVMAKVKPSAILAGVSGADASMVTDMFQGVIAQYKIAKDDIEAISYDISDSIIAVSKNLSKNFDDSVKDISDGLLDAGSVMEMMGYTYKETMALIGATIEVTRQSGSEMGGALRMIGARIGGAKNTGEDVAPEEISNASMAYHKLGIEIVDVNGKFKPMKDTLAELKLQWDTLSDAEKSNIAEMSAGNRRRNTFIAMMESMDKSTALTTIALNSQGETLLTNEKYMESSGAKVQNFKNAMDTLWQNTLSSELLKDVVDLGTAIVTLIDKAGGIPIIIGMVTTALLIHNKVLDVTKWSYAMLGKEAVAGATGLVTAKVASEAVTFAFNKTAIATTLLKGAMTLGLSVAITGVIAGLKWLIDELVQTDAELEEISKNLSDQGQAALDDADKLRTLVEEQIKLEASIRNGNTTTEEATVAKARLLAIYAEIADIAPELINAWDNENNGLATNAEATQGVIKAKEELARINAKLWLQENGISETFAETSRASIDAKKKELEELQRLEQRGIKTTKKTVATAGIGGVTTKPVEVSVMEEIKKLTEEKLKDEQRLYEVMLQEMAAADNESEALAIQNKYIKDAVDAEKELDEVIKSVATSTQRVSFTLKEIDDLLSSSVDKSQKFGDILDEMADKDFKALSSDSAEWILENAPQLIQFFGDEKRLKEELIKLQGQEKITGQQLFADKMLHLSKEQLLAYETMNEKTKYDTDFYNNTVKNNSSLVTAFYNMYGIDLKNYNSLAQAKNAVDIKYGQTAKANYNQIFDGIYRKYGTMVQRMTGNDRMDNLTEAEKRMINFTNYHAGKTAGKTLDAISFTPVGYGGVTMPKSGSSSSGSKDKDDQEYESDVADMNWYVHMVEDYQNRLDKLASSISRTKTEIENLKEIGTNESLAEAIKKEKDMYKLQEQRIALLKEERQALASNMNALQNTINSKYGNIDMSTRTDESLDYYLDTLFPKIVSSSQAVVDARNAQREQFTQMFTDYMMMSDEYLSVDAEYVAMEGELRAIIKERYELEFELMDKQLQKRKAVSEAYANKYALLDNDASFNQREDLMGKQVDGLKSYRQELEALISDLRHQMNLLNEGSQEWVLLNEQAVEYGDELQQTNEEILAMQNNLETLRMDEYNASISVIDKIVGTLKQQYDEAKKAELDALKATVDAEMDIKNAQLDVLQKRLDALNDDTADKAAELRGLREERAMWEQDDSILGKAKLAELDLLIKEKEKELVKDKIETEMEGIQTEIDNLQTFNDEQTQLVEDKYAKLTEEDELYRQASLIFQTATQEEILALLLSYDDKYKGMGSVLGAAFASGLMAEITKGMDGFDSLSDGLLGDASWSNLPTSYDYASSIADKPNDLYTTTMTNLQSMIDAMGGVDGIATSGIFESLKNSLIRNISTNIGTATISMPITFNTNGQLDVNKSIDSLEQMLKDALAGSGVALSLSVN